MQSKEKIAQLCVLIKHVILDSGGCKTCGSIAFPCCKIHGNSRNFQRVLSKLLIVRLQLQILSLIFNRHYKHAFTYTIESMSFGFNSRHSFLISTHQEARKTQTPLPLL
jgi:hypothetical protein